MTDTTDADQTPPTEPTEPTEPTAAPVVIGCSDLLGKLVVDDNMPILGIPHIVVGVGGTKKALAVCGKTGAADHEESLMNANTISNIPEMMELIKAVAHIGLDWGYGEFKLTDEHIKKARAIYEAQGSKEGQKPPTPSGESMITETPENQTEKLPDVGCNDLLASSQPETTPEAWKGRHPSKCHIPIKPMLWNHNDGKCYAGEVVWYDENGWIHGTPAWLTRAFAGRFYGDSLMSLGDKLLLIGGDESTLTFVPRGSWIAQEVSIRAIDPLTFNTKFYGSHIRQDDEHHNFMVRDEDLVMECNSFS